MHTENRWLSYQLPEFLDSYKLTKTKKNSLELFQVTFSTLMTLNSHINLSVKVKYLNHITVVPQYSYVTLITCQVFLCVLKCVPLGWSSTLMLHFSSLSVSIPVDKCLSETQTEQEQEEQAG